MWLIISAISILAIAAIALLANKILRIKICAICAGVAGTWAWLLAARFAGLAIDILVLGIMMGGSVVGLAYKIEKRIPFNRSPLAFLTFFITSGFAAIYGLISSWWLVFGVAALLMAILVFVFLNPRPRQAAREKEVNELEDKMKKCC